MTRKQNLLNMLSGRKPEWVPCSINLWQWHKHHKAFGTLPEELLHTGSDLDAMKLLGCDFFTRNVPCQPAEFYEGLAVEEERIRQPMGMRTIRVLRTPHGDLRQVHQEQAAMTTGHDMEHCVHDWETQGRAYLYALERLRFTWDRELFARTHAEVGEHGLIMLPVGQTPLKRLHIDFGLEYASVFMMLHPEAAKICCDAYWAHLWPMLCEVAEEERVHAAILMDNVDTPSTPRTCAGSTGPRTCGRPRTCLNGRGNTCWSMPAGNFAGFAMCSKLPGCTALRGSPIRPSGISFRPRSGTWGTALSTTAGFPPMSRCPKPTMSSARSTTGSSGT